MRCTGLFGSKFSQLLPSYSKSQLKKGDSGKIGVIGGSFEFVGAPYFASMGALRAVA